MFNIEYLQTNMRCLCLKKIRRANLTSLEKFKYTVVLWFMLPWHTFETMWSSVSRQKSIIYVWMWDNFANILRKFGEKSLSKISCYVLLLARENLKLKNSYILAKTWLSAPKITRPKKLQHCFPIIISIFMYHGHKKQAKNQKY